MVIDDEDKEFVMKVKINITKTRTKLAFFYKNSLFYKNHTIFEIIS